MTVQHTLPLSGAVLGIDVGYSAKSRSSAVCRLAWDTQKITWVIRRFRAVRSEQETCIDAVAGENSLQAVALDGPLRAGFTVIGRYRTAERLLTRRLVSRVGKPGQSSAPVGMRLNAAANDCAGIVLQQCKLATARHAVRIHQLAVVEAFPSSFLGVMLRNPAEVAARRDNRSDAFFEHLTATDVLQNLLDRLLPGRACVQPLSSVTNHDDRAALVCALTALVVAADDFTAVGDDDGWIVLPPRCFVQDWAWNDLEANARHERPGCLYQTPSWQLRDASQPEDHPEETACDKKGAVIMSVNAEALIEKIRAMPEEQLYEVEDFVDFIRLREQQRALTRDAAAASAAAFAAIWDNPEDDVYDAL